MDERERIRIERDRETRDRMGRIAELRGIVAGHRVVAGGKPVLAVPREELDAAREWARFWWPRQRIGLAVVWVHRSPGRIDRRARLQERRHPAPAEDPTDGSWGGLDAGVCPSPNARRLMGER